MAFEKISAYDAPGVLIEQVIDGTISQHSIPDILREVMTNDPSVPPQFRKDLETRIFGTWGDQNPVAKTIAGLASNPLVWLMMLTHVPAKNVLGGLFDVAASKGAWIRQRSGLLKFVETFEQAGRGTSGPVFVRETLEGIMEADGAFKSKIAPAYQEMLLRNGKALTSNTEESRYLNMLLQIKMEGLNKDVTRLVPRWAGGKYAPEMRTTKALVNVSDDVLDQMLEERGALKFANAAREALNDRRKLLLGREDLADFEVDETKLFKLYSHLKKGGMQSKLSDGVVSVGELFGAPLLNQVKKGKLGWDEFKGIVKQIVTDQYTNPHYMPRNVYEAVDSLGGPVIRGEGLAVSRGILPVAPGTRFRGLLGNVIHADDLDFLQRHFGPSEGLNEAYKTLAARKAKMNPGEVLTLRRLDFATGLQRYMTSTGRTYSLYVRPLSDEALQLQKKLVDEARATGLLPKGKLRGKLMGDAAGDLDAAFLDIPEHLRPEGGFSAADGLDQFYRLIGDRNHALKSFTDDVVLPHLLGRTNVENTVAHSVKITLQNWTRGLMDTGIIKSMKGVSAYSDDVLNRLEAFATTPVSPGQSLGASRGIASYLYLTHLSQIPSVLMNLTQPLITTARWTEAGDLLKAYPRALRQMGNLTADIVKNGGPSISKERLAALIEKHVPLADLADIKPDVMEILDFTMTSNSAFKGLSSKSAIQSTKSLLMSGFTGAEMLNRVVTAEAFAAKAARLGVRDIRASGRMAALARDEIRTAVAESQFGSSLLNTPRAFLDTKNPLSNPLLKQFLQFPTRMMTSPFLVGSIAGGETNAALGVLNDVVRGMGLSAIGYEVLKGMAGVQYDEAGFFAGTTQLFTGFIDGEDGPLPIPPVISIASDFGKYVTGQDQEFVQRTLPRLIPGGLQIARAMGVSPQVDVFPEWRLGTTYADWKNPNPDGTINVFKRDGSLMTQSTPTDLVLRGLGLDMTKFQDQSQIDRFMTNMRDEMTDYRRKLATALLNENNPAKALEIQRDFKKRFGFDLKMDKSQLKSALDLRTQPRTERILERMPKEVRLQYAELIRQSQEAQNVQERANEASVLR